MVRRVLLSRVREPRSALCLSGAGLIDRARLQSILDWSAFKEVLLLLVLAKPFKIGALCWIKS